MSGCALMICRDPADPLGSSRFVLISKQNIHLDFSPNWIINFFFPGELRKYIVNLRKACSNSFRRLREAAGVEGRLCLPLPDLFCSKTPCKQSEVTDDKDESMSMASTEAALSETSTMSLSRASSTFSDEGGQGVGDIAMCTDALVGSMTGTNSIVGAKPGGGKFVIMRASLGFSIAVVFVCAVVCMSIMLIGRKTAMRLDAMGLSSLHGPQSLHITEGDTKVWKREELQVGDRLGVPRVFKYMSPCLLLCPWLCCWIRYM